MADTLLTGCPQQILLDDHFCTLGSEIQKDCPLTTYGYSNFNGKRAIRDYQVNSRGERVALKLKWEEDTCVEPEEGCSTDLCTNAALDTKEVSQTIDLSPCQADISFNLGFSVNIHDHEEAMEMAYSAKAGEIQSPNKGGNIVQRKLYQTMRALNLKGETSLSTQIIAGLDDDGGFSTRETGVTFTNGTPKAKKVRTYGTVLNGGTTFNDAHTEVVESAMLAGFCTSTPLVVGGKSIEQYYRRMNAGCCSSNGLNIEKYFQEFNMAFLRSWDVQNILGDDHFLSIEPGAIQLVPITRFVGNFAWSKDTSFRGVIEDPYTRRLFDLSWEFKTCADGGKGAVVYNLSLSEKVVIVPFNKCVGDHRAKVNGIQLFNINNN